MPQLLSIVSLALLQLQLLYNISTNAISEHFSETCSKCGEKFWENYRGENMFFMEIFDGQYQMETDALIKGRANQIYNKQGGMLFHVRPELINGRGGQQIHNGQCVVVKMNDMSHEEDEGFRQYMRDSKILLDSLAKAGAKRIIRTFLIKELPKMWVYSYREELENGLTKSTKKWSPKWVNKNLHSAKQQHIFLTIMEQAQFDLQDWWMNEMKTAKGQKLLVATEWEQKIVAIFREMLLAVKEFHQIAIHNDLAPTNFMFVREQSSGQLVLKLIDFDSIKLLPSTTPAGHKMRRANLEVPVQDGNRYQSFASPELCKQQPISTKSDIYALGAILREFVLESVPSHIHEQQGHVYAQQLFDGKKDSYAPNQEYKARIEAYILANYANLYKIFTAMMAKNPNERPTALGVLEYLNGKCQLKFDDKTGTKFQGTNCNKETSGWIEMVVEEEEAKAEDNK